ncbi:MAG: FAD-binding oxidoreductase [SAR202 cluster bacterium]|nr:FAD-binding oxidoreductase [SAR202 cluster bacterium]
MNQSADIVIIGGGVMGASIAFNLAGRGHTNVVLLEARKLAAEGTGHSGALVRQHYSQDVITRLARRSVDIFENFDRLTGGGKVFEQTGWIKLGTEAMRPAMEKNLVRHRALGVDARMLTIDELKAAIPGMNVEGIGSALIEPRGGYADPVATTLGFAHRARALGAQIREGEAATGIDVQGGRVTGVRTTRGRIATRTVVNAAGPWGAQIAAWVGVTVPLEVTREQDIVLACDDLSLIPRMPVSNGVDRDYWRREPGDLLLVGDGHPKEIERADPDSFKRAVDRSFVDMIMGRLSHRLPRLAARARVVRGYASLYDVTPDWHPILGKTDVDGFVLCVGFSGHGFKLGPAIGEVIADELVGRRPGSIDVSTLGLDRFASGRLLEGSYAGNQA